MKKLIIQCKDRYLDKLLASSVEQHWSIFAIELKQFLSKNGLELFNFDSFKACPNVALIFVIFFSKSYFSIFTVAMNTYNVVPFWIKDCKCFIRKRPSLVTCCATSLVQYFLLGMMHCMFEREKKCDVKSSKSKPKKTLEKSYVRFVWLCAP